ncbi:hypothetical protein DACRYDRAFT_119885 [Dacryopinax primogenitus]|uniref:PHD-type domain-containing protein n=1 Tax=Dacryopinax primogenitus (strain DJM 731) TaxID=1858805 RepID=M5FUD1_DACPD|nr:uncharacterized protein DACRYDRAFT_119885 [Dacryopinax primogenitus]EJT96841.1 hypothetical protein DACRYDRAFT_119885 [Dacryopinax primogenitus]
MSSLPLSLPALNPPPAIRQPADLPTSDPSLATELMPAPPPLSYVTNPSSHHGQRLPILTRSGANRYLPSVDLGTTYTGHGILPPGAGSLETPPPTVLGEGGEPVKPKRNTRGAALGPNAKSTAVNRVQRVTRSSRPATDSPAPGSHSTPPPPVAGPSGTTHAVEEVDDAPERPPKRQKVENKGKGKEKEPIKEGEPIQMNKDYCETCGGIGEFICCDGCTRSYHFLCLNPPVELDDIPEDKWYCGVCLYNHKSHPKLTNRFLGALAQKVESESPKIFKLPDPIREYFKSVTTGLTGEYVQQGQARGGRLNKYGAVEERDPYRLKDKNGKPILCYKCKGPAVPVTLPEAQRKTRAGSVKTITRPIISCDFCSQHWHYDCLEPPLVHPPANWKKWQCPLHVEQLFPMKRIPAKGVKTVDVNQRNKPNNGIIDVIFPEEDLSSMKVENVVINGKRYRIPEKTIILDFWDALQGKRPEPAGTESVRTSVAPTDVLTPLPNPALTRTAGLDSAFSSPLSSLSSLSSVSDEDMLSDTLSEQLEEDHKFPPSAVETSPVLRGMSTPPQQVGERHINEHDAAEILVSFSHGTAPNIPELPVGLGIFQSTPLTDRTNHEIERPSTPPMPRKVLRSATKTNGSSTGSARPSNATPGSVAKGSILSSAREQLKNDVHMALLPSSRPSSPMIVSSTPSSPQPKPGITVKQKEDGSFTLRLPSLKRTLSHQNNHAMPSKAVEEDASSLPLEEINRLQAVRRLLQKKGESALLKFLES